MYEQKIVKNINEITHIEMSKASKRNPKKRTIVFGNIPFPSQYAGGGKEIYGVKYSQINGVPIFNDI
ncbi:hypothetical protein [Clostridium beijerinckii]|uniref:hypothetical protein n=1 Tax=Clostridium beijerinckii TaxID=1520 RepID=UPI00156E63AC|nr:hypothetical protein [Clostridium beijerinckii]